MPVRVQEHIQYTFLRAGREYHSQAGDINELSSMLPNLDTRQIQRSMGWAAHVNFPSGFTTCKGAFYDWSNEKYVFIGQDGSSQLASAVATSAWSFSGPNTLVASSLQLGGLDGLNVQWWGGDLYCIGSDKKVYRGLSYTAAISALYSTTDAQAIAPAADRMFLATEGGDVLRLNDADDAFESYFAPVGDLDVRFMAPFRGYLLIVTRSLTGNLLIHRLATNATNPSLDTIASVPAATGDNTLAGLLSTRLFALHDDDLWLSAGRDTLLDTLAFDLYRFNGSQVQLVGAQPMTTASPLFFGLQTWRHHLLLYDIASAAQTFKTLVGDRFTATIPALAVTVPAYTTCFVLGGDLVTITQNGSDEGVRYTSPTALSDGYIVTPRLDMGSPAKQKRLERITVLLDNAHADFDVILKYRTNDNTSWTTATTTSNTRRVTVGDLGVAFYILQVRVDINDDSGSNLDCRINAISVQYSINT